MKTRILCIDDSKAVHAFLKICVEDVSSDFKSVFDGEEALEFLKANQDKVDLIFLDWEMPKMEGPEVLVSIKSQGVQAPVIMLTSKNKISDISAVLSQGAAEYIMKPFTKDIILEKIAMVLDSGKRG